MIATIRHAIRSLRRSPAFSLTVIATLGIGIGLNAAIFTVVDCVLLRPLGYHDADRIVGLQTHFVDENRSVPRIGGDDYNDVARQVKGLEATAFYQGAWPEGISINGSAFYLPVADVSPRFMEVMGVQPVAGRLFNGGDVDGHDALIGESFAREHFGSVSAAIGQTIHYDNGSHTVVGVLPEAFSFPRNAHIWMETKPEPATANRTAYNQQAIGKRLAGVTPEQLAAELAAFSVHLQQAFPEDKYKTLETVPLQEQIVGKIRPMLNLLMGSVGVILLIICANITHLQLVRATRQLRSVTIRTALGASRSVLASRALVEALLLAVGGSVAAVLIAVPALKLLVRVAPPELPRLAEVRLNGDVFVFAFLISVLLMAVTALLPVWRSWRVDPASALRQDAARGTESSGSLRLRDGIVVVEVALTLTLSVLSVVVARQLLAQSKQDLGFASESLVTLDTHAIGAAPFPKWPKEATPEAIAAYESAALPAKQARLAGLDATLASVSSVPGVISAGAILGAPMGFGGSNVGYAVRGRQVFGPPFKNLPNAELRPVTPGIFATMGVPLLRGRALNADDRLGAPPVLLIDQTLAREIFPNEDPIGKQIMCGYDDIASWWTIVGVVGAIHGDSPSAAPTATFYVPVAQHPGGAGDMQIVVRTALAPSAMAATLRNSLAISHPEIAVKATTMRENIGETQRSDTFRSLLFGSFAGVSILLAAVGMYGVTAYSVAQRKFEFGLRVALGANKPQLFGMVLRKALGFAAVGMVLGVGMSLGLMRVLASVVGKLPAFDPVAYVLASLVVLGIAMIAMFLPARAAANVDPMTVLRSE
jgi:putative ABC transport system permease protein